MAGRVVVAMRVVGVVGRPFGVVVAGGLGEGDFGETPAARLAREVLVACELVAAQCPDQRDGTVEIAAETAFLAGEVYLLLAAVP